MGCIVLGTSRRLTTCILLILILHCLLLMLLLLLLLWIWMPMLHRRLLQAIVGHVR